MAAPIQSSHAIFDHHADAREKGNLVTVDHPYLKGVTYRAYDNDPAYLRLKEAEAAAAQRKAALEAAETDEAAAAAAKAAKKKKKKGRKVETDKTTKAETPDGDRSDGSDDEAPKRRPSRKTDDD